MTSTSFDLIGVGVYSLSEAERFTGIPRKRLRRWLEGYSFVSTGRRRVSSPVFTPDLGRGAGELALSFSDLIEIRFLDAFLQHGVSWRSVRIAAGRARELLSRSHPFSSRVFKTDGRDILAEITRPGKTPDLLNLVRNQYELRKVVSPMLYAGLEFNDLDAPERWWPIHKRRGIVLDPQRSFGAPIYAPAGVRTETLVAALGAEGSPARVATLFEVPLSAVRAAVAFESRFYV